MRNIRFCMLAAVFALATNAWTQITQDNSQPVDQGKYASREKLPDPSAPPCDQPSGVPLINRSTQNKLTNELSDQSGSYPPSSNLYHHLTGTAGYGRPVLITSEGAVVVDPGSTCGAIWLKDEIDKRFHVPVKYVLLSHGHFDHNAGSQVFQQAGAIVIAHKNALDNIVGNRYPSAVPDRLFMAMSIHDKPMVITLGSETVTISRVASSHSSGMIQFYFNKEKVLYCPDVCQGGTLALGDMHDLYFDGWLETLEWVLQQDVSIIDTGHRLGTMAQQREQLEILTGLRDQCYDFIWQGLAFDDAYRKVKWPDFARKYPNFQSNYEFQIEGVWRLAYEHNRALY